MRVDADAPPTPQVRGQHRQAVHPVACILSSRRKRDRPTAVTDVQEVGAGSIAGVRPVGQCQAGAGAGHEGRRSRCFSTHPFRRHAMIVARGWPLLPPARGIAVSAGITPGAKRSRRLQGLPPAMAGRVRQADSVPQNTDEASSSAPCILRGLVDAASTLSVNPHRPCMMMVFYLIVASK